MVNFLIFGMSDYDNSIMCLNIGSPKTVNFPFGTNGKLLVLGVLVLKRIRMISRLRVWSHVS